MYLLDTNTIIYYLKAALPPTAMQAKHQIVDEQPLISVITKIELLGFNMLKIEEQNITEIFINASVVFDLGDAIINQTIALREQYKIKLSDAMIAATEIVYDLSLITRNSTDFSNIENFKSIDPNLL
jgi:predicted nucleic acid-binding protein